MEQQPGMLIKKRTATVYFAGSLLIAALLTVFGFFAQDSFAPFPENRMRLIVVCVSGFSWDRIIPLNQSRQLPFLAQLFRGRGTCGDIISSRPEPDAAIVASLFTGCFPEKHAMYREADFMRFKVPGQFQKPVWQQLAERGQPSMAVGLPAAAGQEGDAAAAIPHGVAAGGGAALTEKYLQRITAGERIPDELQRVLRECVSSDVAHMQQAVNTLATDRSLHLFAFFQGLGRWQRVLMTQAGALPDRVTNSLINNYYIFFDTVLARLYSQCGENGIFLVLSERGNLQGRPAYGNYFPQRAQYPAIGFFYAAGPYIRQSIELLVLDPADLVPTLLYVTGNPFINSMDGRVIFKLLEEHYYFKRKIIANTKILLSR
jgi:hypothetical protein